MRFVYIRDIMQNDNFFNKVYDVVRKIPKGNVATYGQIAALCGNKMAARIVGCALHVNPEPFVIPCHRVVNRFGGLARAFAFGGLNVQKELLLRENIDFIDEYTVDFSKYLWNPLKE